MELFPVDSSVNLLPADGIVQYYGKLFERDAANRYYNTLLETIPWEPDQALIFGKLIITKRKIAWYGDEAFDYTYSNITKNALQWTPVLQELKSITELYTGEMYNSCLMNLYHN